MGKKSSILVQELVAGAVVTMKGPVVKKVRRLKQLYSYT